MMLTKQELIEFEAGIARLFEEGRINCPVHLSGGNEDALLSIFQAIKEEDWVLSTHRNHYHYLLKTGNREGLFNEIMGIPIGVCGGMGRSMHIIDIPNKFLTSAIVGGTCGIAVGLGLALKKGKKGGMVWCFVGDGAEDGGHFMEAVRFSLSHTLPVTFIVEDNDLAVETNKKERWQHYSPIEASNIIRYTYKRTYPHVGIGKHVSM